MLLQDSLLSKYQQEPNLWLNDVLDDFLRWSKQKEIIESVRDNRNTYVKSCHGVGKTFTAKDVVMWFLYCFIPSKVITTAPSWPQVEKLLWSEINTTYKNAKTKLGGVCLKTALNIEDDWFALGISPKIETTDEASRMTGFHSSNLLVVFDEAPAVNIKLWEIKEALMTSENVRFLAIGNPILDTGYFFEGFRNENINSINMLIFDSPNFQINKVTSKEDILEISRLEKIKREDVLNKMKSPYQYLTTVRWAVERVMEWGYDSPMTQARVWGEFPEKSEDTIISYSALERCKLIIPQFKQRRMLGIDVARFGTNFTCFIGYEDGKQIYKEKWNGQDIVKTANRAMYLMKHGYKIIVIDDTGVGGGVTDILQDFKLEDGLKTEIIPINFAEAAMNDNDYDGIVTEMYFFTKELIESQTINLVDDGKLFAELSSRKYKFKKGKFSIESKEDYKKRTGLDSPDEADAFVLCQWGNKFAIADIIETYGERETAEQW